MIKNILILNMTRMGDLVQSTSSIAGLRKQYPNACITLMVTSAFEEFSKKIPDERGSIMHMLRNDDPHFEKFGEIYFSTAYPGSIKGWHEHKEQVQNYAVVYGMIKLVMYDNRKESKTYKNLIEIFMGDLNSLKERVSSRYRDPVSYYIDHVGDSSALGIYLDQFRGLNKFSIKTMVNRIAEGEGDLSQEELLVLMTDQIVKSKA